MEAIGPWTSAVSRSTGKRYWFNPATKESLWHDDALPVGWAWGRTAPLDTAPKFYAHLATGVRQSQLPELGQVPPAPYNGYPAIQSHMPSTQQRAPVPPPLAPPPAVDLALHASVTAGDDLLSTAYIPKEADHGAGVPEKVRSKRDYLFSSIPADRRWALQVDEVALYSVTEARVADDMTARLEELVPTARRQAGRGSIVDATACVGGNTLSFARSGSFGCVVGVELSAQRAGMLRHNASLLGAPAAGRVAVVNADFAAMVASGPGWVAQCASGGASGDLAPLLAPPVDVVFMDPPWGGPEYASLPSLRMFLGTTDVAFITAALTAPIGGPGSPPSARWVAIKAPLNYDVPALAQALEAGGTGARVDRVDTWKKMQVLLVKAAEAPRPLGGPAAAAMAALYRAQVQAQSSAPSAGAATAGDHARSGSRDEDGDAPAAKRARPEPSQSGGGSHAPASRHSHAGSVRVSFQAVLRSPLPGSSGLTALLPSAAPAWYLAPGPTLVPRPVAWDITPGGAGLADGLVSMAALGEPVVAASSPQQWRITPAAGSVTALSLFTLAPAEQTAHSLALPGAADAAGLPAYLSRLVSDPAGIPLCPAPSGDGGDRQVLFTPVFASDAGHLLLRPGSTAEREAGLPLAAGGTPTPDAHIARLLLSLPASLGHLSHSAPWDIGAVAGRGKRAVVVRTAAAAAAGAQGGSAGTATGGLAVKVQAWDDRVSGELAVMSAVAQHCPSDSPLLAPLWVGRDAARAYVVMRDAGRTADEAVAASGPLPSHLAAFVLRRLLGALSSLHGLGYLHCDVHPGNLLVRRVRGEGHAGWDWAAATLVDLGSAQPCDASGGYSGPPRGGRWDTQPLEQFGSGPWATGGTVHLTRASDLCAAAASVAWLLTGAAPFGPAQAGAKLVLSECQWHPRRQPTAMRALIAPLLQPSQGTLLEVLLACLQPEPHKRPATAAQALSDLEEK